MLGSNLNSDENISRAKEKINDKYEIVDESTVLTLAHRLSILLLCALFTGN